MKEKKELQKLIKIAQAQGWRVERTKGMHIRFLSPDKKSIVVTSTTTSDYRSIKNCMSRLHRAGLDI